ncbi:threonine/serine exporter family protein [Radiobacillus kanasensis]|uniref:threonine/serine exporter family protein n=1 Tax=Radiobacillus kanasensis TaxID=2844358 RepID=UPI001E5495FE|nr:threonine/serine exporter family protein [Radiobacillus kanasensis]UFT99153.1 threonine/serine exporter family protein [Radiobacillus kanasensis]
MFAQLITSFIAAAGFGVLFNAPRRSLLHCGWIGMLGWILYYWLSAYQEVDEVPATLAAAFLVGVLSQHCARVFKTPIIIFDVSGIIPLVPGGLAYDAMRNFVENDYNAALQLAAKAFLISGAIAIGLVFSEVVNQLIRRRLRKPSQSIK